MATPEPKVCDACGRRIEWRRRWADEWNQVRWCSQACRRRKLQPDDLALETAILELLSQRSNGATICPSEAARSVAGHEPGDDQAWRELMEPARRAARRLVARQRVEITQGGRVVDPSTAKGPIRIRLRR